MSLLNPLLLNCQNQILGKFWIVCNLKWNWVWNHKRIPFSTTFCHSFQDLPSGKCDFEIQTDCVWRDILTLSLTTSMWFAANQPKAGRTWSCERSSSSRREPLRWWPASATEVGGRDPLPEEPPPTDPRPVRAAWFIQPPRPPPPRPRWATPPASPSVGRFTTRLFYAHFVSHSSTLHSLMTSFCVPSDFSQLPFVDPCLFYCFCLPFHHDVPLFLRINTLPEIMISPGLQTANPPPLLNRPTPSGAKVHPQRYRPLQNKMWDGLALGPKWNSIAKTWWTTVEIGTLLCDTNSLLMEEWRKSSDHWFKTGVWICLKFHLGLKASLSVLMGWILDFSRRLTRLLPLHVTHARMTVWILTTCLSWKFKD